MQTFRKSLAALVLLGVVSWFAFYGLMNARNFQLFGKLVSKIETKEKVVALTIDDGPGENVDEILALLAAEDVPATFFLMGQDLVQRPEAARKIVAAGHELGNHSYSHQRMILKDTNFVAKEIEDTDALIRAAGYEGPILFRPPYGKKLWTLPRYLARNDRTTLMWSIEPESFPEVARDARNILRHVEERVHPGAILLLHLWAPERAPSREATPHIIQSLKKQGYRFLKASELLTLGR